MWRSDHIETGNNHCSDQFKISDGRCGTCLRSDRIIRTPVLKRRFIQRRTELQSRQHESDPGLGEIKPSKILTVAHKLCDPIGSLARCAITLDRFTCRMSKIRDKDQHRFVVGRAELNICQSTSSGPQSRHNVMRCHSSKGILLL